MSGRPVQTERRNGTSQPNVATERRNRVLRTNMQVTPVGTGRRVDQSERPVATSLSPKPYALSPSPYSLLPTPRPQASRTRERGTA